MNNDGAMLLTVSTDVGQVKSLGQIVIYLNGSNQELVYEGSTSDAYETFLRARDATADRLIYLPDAAGTVSLTDNASDLISNSVFN